MTALPAIGVAVAVAAGLAAIGHRSALRDLRDVESGYVAGRKATACSIARLDPDPDPAELERLEEMLAGVIADAGAESRRVRSSFEQIEIGPLPVARRSRTNVAEALDAQVALYDAMVAGTDGDRDVRALGRANRRAEDALEDFRSLLLVGSGAGWDDRFNCPSGSSTTRDE